MNTVWCVFYVSDETLNWELDSVHSCLDSAEEWIVRERGLNPVQEMKAERWAVLDNGRVPE